MKTPRATYLARIERRAQSGASFLFCLLILALLFAAGLVIGAAVEGISPW